MNINDLAKMNNLTDEEVLIIDEIIKRIQKGEYKIAIREIASMFYVSTTSIVRLAKKLGYESYSEMLFGFKHQCLSPIEYHVPGVMQTMLITEQSLQVVDELVKDLLSNEYSRIHLVGIGYSQYICDYFSDKLNELDFCAHAKSPLDFVFDKPSLVIFISKSGETKDLLFIEKRCAKLNTKMYALSSNENSTFCKQIKRSVIIKSGRNVNVKFPDYFTGNSINFIEGVLAILYAKKGGKDD